MKASSKPRPARASTWSSASRAWLPDTDTSTTCPLSAHSVATRDRLEAGTGPAPVVTLRSETLASSVRTSCTRRAAGRACRPCGLVTRNVPTMAGGRRSVARPGTPSGPAPTPAGHEVGLLAGDGGHGLGRDLVATGTAGRGDRGHDEPLDQRAPGTARPAARTSSSSSSRASSAERTALPRSMRTTTPSPSSAASTASMICTASVPKVRSSSPAAIAMRSARRAPSPRRGPPQRGPAPGCARRRRCRPWQGRVLRSQASAARAAPTSRAADVAPGSWCPTLRSPR